MDNKRGLVPGYGRGRTVWSNNFDNTVNRPVGQMSREWHQRFGHSICSRGQQPFAAMFNGDKTVSPFVTSGAKSNNSSVGRYVRRGNLSWADIRQQSQGSGFEMRTLEANTFQPDKSHHFFNRYSYTDMPWGGRGRGILEKVNSDNGSSCHSEENNVWGGRGRGSILGAPKTNYDSPNFRSKNYIVGEKNKPHRGQIRGGYVRNQNICSANKRMEMPMPMSVPMTYPIPLPFMFQNLDLNFTCGEQEQNKLKKKQQERKNWHKGKKAGFSGEGGSGRSAKKVGKSSLQSSVSLEGHQNDTETETKKDGQKRVLSTKKRLVIINDKVENSGKIQDKPGSSKSHYHSDSIKGKIIKKVNDTLSNDQQSFAEQPQKSCKVTSDCSNKSLLIRESTIVKEGAAVVGVTESLSQIIKPHTDDSKDEQTNDQT